MGAHRLIGDVSFGHPGQMLKCLIGDVSFGHPGQMLKWMDLRVSPILYTLFDLKFKYTSTILTRS